MTPDATRHDPRPEYLRALLDQAGLSQRAAARQIGIGERTMRQYLAGSRRLVDGREIQCLAPYPVQYAIENLAKKVAKTT